MSPRGVSVGAADVELLVRSWPDDTTWQDRVGGLVAEALPVLDHGFVRVVDYMGDDAAVAEAWKKTAQLGHCRYLLNNAGPPSMDQGPFRENLLRALGSVEDVTSQWLARCSDVAASVVSIASVAERSISWPGESGCCKR